VLTRLEIDSFKAYDHVAVELAPFTVVIGPNGAGKTSVLQAVEFLGALVRGTLKEHLDHRRWEYPDLPHLRSSHKQFGFVATVDLKKQTYQWELRLGARLRSGVARERLVRVADETELMSRDGRKMRRFDESKGGWEEVTQTLTSSWLSTVTEDDRGRFPDLLAIAEWARGIGDYVALNPATLREPSRKTDTLGPTGEGLAGLLGGLKASRNGAFDRVLRRTRDRYPQLRNITVRQGSYGWNRLEVTERWGGEEVTLNARQVSDGLLRLLAISALHELHAPPSVVMLDELENGVHPHLLGGLMSMLDGLVRSGRTQVIATTHSPVALNYVKSANQVLIARRLGKGPARLTALSGTKGYRELGEHFDPGELWYNLGEQRLLRTRR
jgi:predicted ATPase